MRRWVAALPLLLLVPFGAAQAQVPGSYQRSCRQITQNGSTLSATCRGSNGQFNETSIDLERCGNQGVSNSFGRLACGNVVGSSRPSGDDNGGGRGFGGGDQLGGNGVGGYRGARPRYDADSDGSYAAPRRRYVAPDDGGGYPPPPPPRRRYNNYDNDD